MGKRRAAKAPPGDVPDVPSEAPVEPLPRAGSLTRELTRVEELNTLFYESFENLDVETMSSLWSRSPYTRCIHPGWEPVVGWKYIRQSWVEIFGSMIGIEFELEDVHVEVTDNTAWVNLVAHAEVKADDDETFHTAVVATSVFERVEGDWLIVLHHSSHYVEDDELDEDDLEISGFGGGPGDDKPN